MFFFRKPKQLLPKAEQDFIVAAVKKAEATTTGEIRVYVESHCTYVDAMQRAQELFGSMNMHQTENRNAVLVYLATEDKQFALLGDENIYKLAGGSEFWQGAAFKLQSHLRNGAFAKGLEECVQELGKVLAIHFPFTGTVNENELPDEIVFGK